MLEEVVGVPIVLVLDLDLVGILLVVDRIVVDRIALAEPGKQLELGLGDCNRIH